MRDNLLPVLCADISNSLVLIALSINAFRNIPEAWHRHFLLSILLQAEQKNIGINKKNLKWMRSIEVISNRLLAHLLE
jgi:hypothetical protein